jgi:anti-sigma factor RsiW
MTSPSFRDVEQLSTYLDGQLSGTERTRLEARVRSDPELAALLAELRQTRALLRQTPHRRAPRNFTLTPKMAGIRPPVPRLVPALSWASAAAMLLFVCTIAFNLLGSLSLSAAAPRMTSAYGIGGGGKGGAATEAPAVMAAPATMAPAATQALVLATSGPTNGNQADTSTPEVSTFKIPEPTQSVVTNSPAPHTTAPLQRANPVIPWPYIWLGLAVVLSGAALLIRWISRQSFLRKNKSK